MYIEGTTMQKAIEYRSIAARLRSEAAVSGLEHARQMKLSGAERWEALAREIEMVIAPSRRGRNSCWIN
jgi:hypothetical protein